jgi:hypothetical protein
MMSVEVHDMIAVRAYEIYQLRGGEPGREAEDWFSAEREIFAGLTNGDAAENVRKVRSKSSKRTRSRVAKKSANAPISGKRPRKQPADRSIV